MEIDSKEKNVTSLSDLFPGLTCDDDDDQIDDTPMTLDDAIDRLDVMEIRLSSIEKKLDRLIEAVGALVSLSK